MVECEQDVVDRRTVGHDLTPASDNNRLPSSHETGRLSTLRTRKSGRAGRCGDGGPGRRGPAAGAPEKALLCKGLGRRPGFRRNSPLGLLKWPNSLYRPALPEETAQGSACAVSGPEMGRSQAVRQRILIPPFGGSIPPAPASIYPIITGTFRVVGFFILNAGTCRILNVCCQLVRQHMSVALPGSRQHAGLGTLRVTGVARARAMRGQRAALSLRQLSLLQAQSSRHAGSIIGLRRSVRSSSALSGLPAGTTILRPVFDCWSRILATDIGRPGEAEEIALTLTSSKARASSRELSQGLRS